MIYNIKYYMCILKTILLLLYILYNAYNLYFEIVV